MANNDEQFNQTLNFFKQKLNNRRPKVGLILGSGLSDMSLGLTNEEKIPYSEIPNFPISTVAGHQGNITFGKFGKLECVIMYGRFHYYEGYSMQELTLPIRAMNKLGVKTLILTNAAGGISPDFQPGNIMLILDHINLMGINPLIGINQNNLKTRFVDMTHAYDQQLNKITETVAIELKLPLKRGVYAAMSGPSYETPSEIRMLRTPERKDYSLKPPKPFLLTNMEDHKIPVLGIGKIDYLYADIGVPEAIHTKDNLDGINKLIETSLKFKEGLIFTNLIDFDMLYGHRRDVEGFHSAFAQFDKYLPEIIDTMNKDDLLLITADHGTDPTTLSTDHSREYVPIIAYSEINKIGKDLGTRKSFADVGQTISEFFKLPKLINGESFYGVIRKK